MKLQHIITSVIIMCMALLGCITYVSELSTNYGATADLTGLNRTSAYLNKTQTATDELYEDLSTFELSGASDFLLIPYKFFQIGWNLAKVVINSWSTVFSIFTDGMSTTQSQLGASFPTYILSGIIAILIITLVVIAIYAFFKWKFED